MNISVVIPVYKQRELFLRNLRHNLPYLKHAEIIIVNDDPDETLKEKLASFDMVKLIENSKNMGFGESVNRGVIKTKNRYVVLLNSDVRLMDTSFEKAVNHFKKDPRLFAVSFAQKEKNGSIVGKNKIYWKQGMFHHRKAQDLQLGKNAWAEGGACMIDKNKFIKLGGFDSIFTPFYWEDIDLSYRAWKSKYSILFDPDILVVHHHESTIGAFFSKNQIAEIAYRNQFLFMWKNIHEVPMVVSQWACLPYYIFFHLFKGDVSFMKGLFLALKLKPRIKKEHGVLTDSHIINLFTS